MFEVRHLGGRRGDVNSHKGRILQQLQGILGEYLFQLPARMRKF